MIPRSLFVASGLAVLSAACSARDVPLFDVAPETAGRAGSSATGGEATTGGQDTGGSHQSTGGAAAEASGGAVPAGGTGGIGGLTGAAGPGSGGMDGACAADAECSTGWFCHKPDCSTALGACEPREVFCDPAPDPVCGCDGLTYWNECVWRQVGTGAFIEGECGAAAKTCDRSVDCGSMVASCSRLVFQYPSCPALNGWTELPPGLCWVTPARCNPAATADRWILCPPPGMTLPPPNQRVCADTCTAIAYQLPAFLARPGDGCT
jgi:hypothetical protein